MRWLPLLAVVVAGCASAKFDGQGNNGDVDAAAVDSPIVPPIDGATVDAPPVTVDAAPDAPPQPVTETLQQTTNTSITAANSVACGNSTAGTTAENSWYRVFIPAEQGITNTFTVNQITFGVQESAGSPTVQVKVGTYTGTVGADTIDLAKITPINSATATVPPTTTGVMVPVAITAAIPPSSQIIVEILAPDLSATTGTHVYIGATTAAETHPSYIRAPACSIATPQTVGKTGFPNAHAIITVTGTH
jgi:hypothetical protein